MGRCHGLGFGPRCTLGWLENQPVIIHENSTVPGVQMGAKPGGFEHFGVSGSTQADYRPVALAGNGSQLRIWVNGNRVIHPF